MNVLRLSESKRLLVVARKEADAFVFDRPEDFRQLLEARVGQVVKSGQEFGVYTFDVEPFVGEVDALRIIAHADPTGAITFFYGSDGVTKKVRIRAPSANVNVANGEKRELVRS